MVTCSAPGKVILFGEHAVVFGEPAMATAIDLRTKVTVAPSKRWRVNHGLISHPRQKYVKAAVDVSKATVLMDIDIISQIPEG